MALLVPGDKVRRGGTKVTRSRDGTLSVSNDKQTKQANHQLSFSSRLVDSMISPFPSFKDTQYEISNYPYAFQ